MLTEAFQARRINLAELAFDYRKYLVADLTFRVERPNWMEEQDRVIDLILASDSFSHDLVEWMARNDGEIPSVDLNVYEENKTHTVRNATPTQWGGKHVTLVGGMTIEVQQKIIQVSVNDDKEWALRIARDNVQKMKQKDPALVRFEIDLED